MILAILVFFQLSLDVNIRNYIQKHRTPFWDKTFQIITDSGDKLSFFAFETILATSFGDYERDDAKLLLYGVGTTAGVTALIKFLTRRKRPSGEMNSPWNSSFPSGHTSGAFALATIMSLRHKKLTIPFFTWATLVGFSRIYLDKHWTTDVIAGAILGISFGYLTFKNKDKILKIRIF